MARPATLGARLFLTCWLVYGLHFATDMVRENYLALAIGDHFSFRVDEYAGMHDDIFEHPGHGWHIGSNPGASMLGALPYALSRPLIDPVVARINRNRQVDGDASPPRYAADKHVDRRLYEEAWRRGFDIKFGLGSLSMQLFCMALLSAFGVVVMFRVLEHALGCTRTALWLGLLYAFGTPVFLRTGFLNHNMILGHVAFAAFAVLWNPGPWLPWSPRRRMLVAGLGGGLSLLLDYSGLFVLVGLWVFSLFHLRSREISRGSAIAAYASGAVGPVLLLWFYQWRSFGHPFLPPQHWMPPVVYIEEGYQGVAGPQPDLAWALAFDFRYGLFVACPLFLLALASPFLRLRDRVPRRVITLCLILAGILFVFFSGVHYTRWQFVTGIRYLAPAFPFLFLLAAAVLVRLPRKLGLAIGLASVALGWCMAMSRDISGGKIHLDDPDSGLGIAGSVIDVLLHGPQLPVLETLTRLEGPHQQLGPLLSPLPLFVVLAAMLYLIWRPVRGVRNPDPSP